VATHAETVVVPDVSGIIESKAVEQLQAAGLVVGERFTAADALPAGYVIATEPHAGASMTRGSAVDYVTSDGPVSDTTLRPAKTARPATTPVAGAITSAPATLRPRPPHTTQGPSATFGPAGTPIVVPPTLPHPTLLPGTFPSPSPAVSPSAGLWPSPTASASPVLSPTPFPAHEPILVGDFLCLDLGTARSHLKDAGLLVGATIPDDPVPDDSWIIHDQLPKAGEFVPLGTAVDLVLMEPLAPCPAG
jgi:beta-lactam-binding protein with PASTA domain